jgi:hypothetical protein
VPPVGHTALLAGVIRLMGADGRSTDRLDSIQPHDRLAAWRVRVQGYCDALLCRSQKKGMSTRKDCDLVSGVRWHRNTRAIYSSAHLLQIVEAGRNLTMYNPRDYGREKTLR